MTKSEHVVGVVLAAGSSRRLGQPKQLVSYNGQPLVARVAQQLSTAGCSSVITVVGSNAARVRRALDGTTTQIVDHTSWTDGIGSSISAAVQHLHSDAVAVLIALSDQPLIETAHYRALIETLTNGTHSIAATECADGSAGVPAAFGKKHFSDLASLSGGRGAKTIIATRRHRIVPLQGQHFDLDTPADLERLRHCES